MAKGTVYVGSEDDLVYALRAGTGTPRWAYRTSVNFSSPAVNGGTVYIGSTNHKLYALSSGRAT